MKEIFALTIGFYSVAAACEAGVAVLTDAGSDSNPLVPQIQITG